MSSVSNSIGIYRGSFDPPHIGHKEVVDYCLNVEGCSKVYIVSCDANVTKPFRTSDSIRLSMLKALFSDNERVVVTKMGYRQIKEEIETKEPDAKIASIFGSDILSIGISKSTQNDTCEISLKNYILLIPRDGDDLSNIPNTLNGKKIVLAKKECLKHQNHSSTEIRDFFKVHPEVFSSNDDQQRLATECLPLAARVKQVILEHKLYCPVSSNEPAEAFKSKIYPIVKNMIMENHEAYSSLKTPLSVINTKTNLVRGLSGDWVYAIQDSSDAKLFFAKVFCGDTKEKRFKREHQGLEFYAKQQLSQVKTPTIKHLNHDHEFPLLMLDAMPGHSIEKLIYDYNHGAELDIQCLEDGIEAAGYALAELHSKPCADLSENEELFDGAQELHLEKACKRLANLCDSAVLNGQQLTETLRLHFREYKANRGTVTSLHGDPHPGNWLYDHEKRQMSFIDFSDFAIGSPAYDYYYALAALARKSCKLINSTNRSLQEAFIRGYRKFGIEDFASFEAKRFFCGYWLLRYLNNDLKTLENERTQGQDTLETSSRIMQRYSGILNGTITFE